MARKMFHLKISEVDIKQCQTFILPGDPDRVPKIGKHLEDFKILVKTREYHLGLGKLNGNLVGVCSTGIGGPSTAICIEELAMCGVKNFLRIGTTGAIQKHIQPGEMIAITGAVRFDGTSKHIAPIEFPAVSSYSMLRAIDKASEKTGLKTHFGISASSDTFYQGQSRTDTYMEGFAPRNYENQINYLQKLGVLAMEMEASTVLTQAAAYGLTAGAVTGVLVNRCENEIPSDSVLEKAEDNVIQLGLATISQFLT